MNKIESRHRLIRSIISERRIHTQQELQEALEANGVLVTQSTLSRDVKSLNLVKINEGDSSYYAMNTIAPSRWPADVYGRCLSHVAAGSKPGRCKNSSRSCPILWSYLRCIGTPRNCSHHLWRRCLFGYLRRQPRSFGLL